jgi:phosphoglycerate dehydrogenase-like enzyme
MSKPLVAIIDWSNQPHGNLDTSIERNIIGDSANVQTYVCNSDEDFSGEILEAAALIVGQNNPIRRGGIRRLKQCRAIICNSVGCNFIDERAAADCNIAVCDVPDYGAEEVADHGVVLALALCRHHFQSDAEAKALEWLTKAETKKRLSELDFGIIGLGRVGTATASRAKMLGFKVSFYDPYRSEDTDKVVGITRVRNLKELLRQSDVLSINCRLTAETHHLISHEEINLMKRSSAIVDITRSSIIKKSALLAALREGRLAGAGWEVMENELLRTAEEAAAPNLIVSCHAAFCAAKAMRKMRAITARIASAAVRGEVLEHVVNGVSPKPIDRHLQPHVFA